jgi:hypothetical protein
MRITANLVVLPASVAIEAPAGETIILRGEHERGSR